MNAHLFEVLVKALIDKESKQPSEPTQLSSLDPEIEGWQIVVLDKEFVAVGEVEAVGDYLVIQNCGHISRWGTDKGLGQLHNGPLPNTKIDRCCEIKVHKLCVVQIIKVNDAAWSEARF